MNGQLLPLTASSRDIDSKIVTFYSYKGGVGRSMVLANVAWVLAETYGLRVLAVDWDLEAPGLHRYFKIPERRFDRGLIDLFLDYKKVMAADKPINAESVVDLNEYCVPTKIHFKSKGSICLLPAGHQDNSYGSRVNGFDWDDFYKRWRGYALVESLRKQFRSEFDVTLIDSRTGVTDSGGICTIQMPDLVVLLFAYNEQNFAGIERVADSILQQSSDRLQGERTDSLILVPSRIELFVEMKDRRHWEPEAATRLSRFLSSEERSRKTDYMIKEAIPYVGEYSFGERIAVDVDPTRELARACRRLTFRIAERLDYPGPEPEMYENRLATGSDKRNAQLVADVRLQISSLFAAIWFPLLGINLAMWLKYGTAPGYSPDTLMKLVSPVAMVLLHLAVSVALFRDVSSDPANRFLKLLSGHANRFLKLLRWPTKDLLIKEPVLFRNAFTSIGMALLIGLGFLFAWDSVASITDWWIRQDFAAAFYIMIRAMFGLILRRMYAEYTPERRKKKKRKKKK